MKNLKFYSILLSLLLFTACENSQRSEEVNISTRNSEIGEGCVPTNMTGCDGGVNEGVYNWIIILNDYPDCIFKVEVEYLSCAQNTFLALGLGEFEYFTEGNCDEFEEDIQLALSNGTSDEFAISFNQQIWSMVTQNLIEDIPDLSPFTTVLQIEYVVGTCQKWCGFNKIRCGDACCSKTNRYELNEDKVWELASEGEIVSFSNTTCDETDAFCDPSNLQNFFCFDNCESLNF